MSDEDKSNESETAKKLDAILKDILEGLLKQ